MAAAHEIRLLTGRFSELQQKREIGVKLIEIALGILAGRPDENKDENKPLRESKKAKNDK